MNETKLKRGDVREFTLRNGKPVVGIVADVTDAGKAVLFVPAFVETDKRQFYNSGLICEKSDPFPGEGIIDLKDIKDVRIKRGLPREYRDCLTDGMGKLNQYRKGRQILEKVRIQQDALSKECGQVIKKARDVSGIMTKKEFEDAVINQLPQTLKWSLSGYSFRTPCDVLLPIDDDNMYLTKVVDTWLPARDQPFCYTEYDGNVFMKEKAKANDKYKKIINKHHKDEPGIQVKQSESLFIAGGYNGRIMYQSFYRIPKPAEYSKEAVKETVSFLLGKKPVKNKTR